LFFVISGGILLVGLGWFVLCFCTTMTVTFQNKRTNKERKCSYGCFNF